MIMGIVEMGVSASCRLLTAFCLLLSAFCLQLLRGFDRIARRGPCIQAAYQSSRIFDSFCFEISHRTGASMFGRSSTVGDNHLVMRKFVDARQHLVGRNGDRALDMIALVRILVARVDDQHVAFCPQPVQPLCGYPLNTIGAHK